MLSDQEMYEMHTVTVNVMFELYSSASTFPLTHTINQVEDNVFRHMTSQAVDPPQSWNQA